MITQRNYYFSLIFLSIISMSNSCRKFQNPFPALPPSSCSSALYATGKVGQQSVEKAELLRFENKYFLYTFPQCVVEIYILQMLPVFSPILCSYLIPKVSYLSHLHITQPEWSMLSGCSRLFDFIRSAVWAFSLHYITFLLFQLQQSSICTNWNFASVNIKEKVNSRDRVHLSEMVNL